MKAKFYWRYLPWEYLTQVKGYLKFSWPARPTSCISHKKWKLCFSYSLNYIFHFFVDSSDKMNSRPWYAEGRGLKWEITYIYCLAKAAYLWKKEPRDCETHQCVQWSIADDMSRLGAEVLVYKSGRGGSAIDNQNHPTSEPNKQEVYTHLQLWWKQIGNDREANRRKIISEDRTPYCAK